MFSTKAFKIWRLANSHYGLFAVLMANSAMALSEVGVEQLHIPRSFIRHLPSLFDGAQLMEQSERCQKFIEGTVSMNNATLKQPVFRYTCRDSQLKTYHLLIDGLTLDILDDTRPSGRISFSALQTEIEQRKAKELEVERLKQEEIKRLKAELQELERFKADELALQKQQQEERERIEKEREFNRKEDSRREHLWAICNLKVSALTSNMQQLQWVTLKQPEPDWASKTLLHYSIDFSSVDYQGRKLQYRAFCRLSTEIDVKVSIHPRALAQMPLPPATD